MRPLFKKLMPGVLASYVSRYTATARTGASKLPDSGEETSRSNGMIMKCRTITVTSTPRTQQDEMDREMDRQLMEFEMGEHRRKESTAGLVFRTDVDVEKAVGRAF